MVRNILIIFSKVFSISTFLRPRVGPFLNSDQWSDVLHVETRNEGQSNSLLKPLLHTKQYPQIVFNETEEVQVYPLDSFQIEGCNFLNIDVQGFELEVLKGSKKTLRGVNYIYSEVNRAETYENCAQIGDMDEFLLFNGFKRVETIWSGGIWGDALWIRE
jgi:hypothetical protein